jgi:hypothetical protein
MVRFPASRLPGSPVSREQHPSGAVEQLPGPADEGLALQFLLLPGTFATSMISASYAPTRNASTITEKAGEFCRRLG